MLGTLSVALAGVARAQPIHIDAVEEPAEPPASEPEPAPEPPAQPVLTRPKPLMTEVSYPEGASGDHEVVLELLVDPEGKVERAVAVSGSAPFTTRAEADARAWRFEPATRDGQPMAAKVRLLVRFTEPEPEPASEPTLGSSPTTGAEPEPAGPEAPAEAPEKPPAPDEIEVLILGERQPLRQRLGRAEVREIPGAFGDPYRAIEVLPGVVPIMSGVPYFYVRGAPPGNVGYFFDGIPVPLLYHFAAGPGVLHPAFVETVDLYAGAYPARYGRFAGGIVVGDMAPPSYDWRGEVSIRLVDSGGMLEAPFADGRGSVMLGGRYSYTGLVLSLVVPEVTLQYWDYQGRARYAVGRDDSVEVLFFGSRDLLQSEEQTDDGEGAHTSTTTVADIAFHRVDLRWDHELPGGRWRNALMLGLDRTGIGDGDVLLTDRMVGARSEMRQRLEPGLEFRAGVDILYERLGQEFVGGEEEDVEAAPGQPPGAGQPDAAAQPAQPSEVQQSDEAAEFGFNRSRDDLVVGLYSEVVIEAAPGVQVTPGLRTDLFVSAHDVAPGVDPRIAARFEITDRLALTHGLGIAHQAPSFVLPIPGAKPSLRGGLQRAVQHSAGVEYELPAGITSSLVLFHNLFFNLTDLLGIAQLNQTEESDDETGNLRMTGHSYGAEVMLRRSLTHDLGGFISYTLSRSERSSGRLEGPATTDRTHVLNLALSYDLGRHWRIGNRVILYSGIPARVAYLEAARHPPRTPPFWRLDWRLQKRWPSADGRGYWGFIAEVLNTTLNEEVMDRSCNAYDCREQSVGPVTIPSIGVEAAF